MAGNSTFDDGAGAPRSFGANAEPVSALQTEVMSAVRGAISNVMAGQGKGIDLAGIDLDFSSAVRAQVPVLLAKPDQALAVHSRKPEKTSTVGSRIAVAAAVSLAVGGAVSAYWYQGVPGGLPQAKPAVAASVDALPVIVAAKASAVPAPDKPVEVDPAPLLTPVVATVRTQAISPPQPEIDIASRARTLMDSGDVAAARKVLLDAPDAARSDIALILARSFDGNYLQSLSHSDVSPDSTEARRWYTRWYELASKDGSVPATVRLDRLLQSLP